MKPVVLNTDKTDMLAGEIPILLKHVETKVLMAKSIPTFSS